jgi:ATP-dependent exoDNAse (exonuclease V) alpha subunit
MMQHYMMLRRNLLYTGITRGRQLVVLVGEKRAIGMAVKGKVESRRWSKLGEWFERDERGTELGDQFLTLESVVESKQYQ